MPSHDGLPLAIELLAARLRRLTLTALADAVSEGTLERATGSELSGIESTLRLAIRSSVGTLSDPERAAFRRLSVFSGGFTLDAATMVCSLASDDPGGIPANVMSLAEKSLIEPDVGRGVDRYRLLEVTKRYAGASWPMRTNLPRPAGRT